MEDGNVKGDKAGKVERGVGSGDEGDVSERGGDRYGSWGVGETSIKRNIETKLNIQ